MLNSKTRNAIEIKRNIIERGLMFLKNFGKRNLTKLITVFLIFILLIIAVLSGISFYNNSFEKKMIKLEIALDTFRADSKNPEIREKTKENLRQLITETRFGFVHKISFYYLGNILFDEGKYREAYDLFLTFIDKTSVKDVFMSIAVNKAAICLEEDGKPDQALQFLLKHEDDKNSLTSDQVLYNIGRLYSIKGDSAKGREYFKRVMDVYPDSAFAGRSRERLFLLSLKK